MWIFAAMVLHEHCNRIACIECLASSCLAASLFSCSCQQQCIDWYICAFKLAAGTFDRGGRHFALCTNFVRQWRPSSLGREGRFYALRTFSNGRPWPSRSALQDIITWLLTQSTAGVVSEVSSCFRIAIGDCGETCSTFILHWS